MSKQPEADNESNCGLVTGPDLTRRRLVQVAGTVLAATTLPVNLARAASGASTIRVGFISPRTGPLAGFGECDPYVLQQARKALAKGLKVGGKHYTVEILDRDTQSDPARASQLAKSLINDAHVDMMLTTSTPEVVNPVSDACEAAGVPCMSTIVPWEAWYFGRGAKPGQPSPFHWTYHFCFGGGDFFKAYNSQWNGPVKTNKKVGILYPNDADGNAVREHLATALGKAGFTIVDSGAYEDGTTDYSAQIAKFKAEQCEIFNTFPIPPDFATFWRQAAQQGYTRMVKIAQIAKTGLFPSQVEALGSLGHNLATACYWHPTWPYKSPLTGLSSQASGRRLREGHRTPVDAAGRRQHGAARCRLRRAAEQRQPEEQGRRRQGDEHAQGRHAGRAGRFHQRAGTERLGDPDHRQPVGQGETGQQVQARTAAHRERGRPQRSDRGAAVAV